MHELHHQCTVFSSLAVRYSWLSSWIICAGWITFSPHKGNGRIRYQVVVVVRWLQSTPIDVPEYVHTEN